LPSQERTAAALITYGSGIGSLESAVKVILREAQPGGKLPVSIQAGKVSTNKIDNQK
jgi:hypothetical protein